MIEVVAEKDRRAHAWHRCDNCGRWIVPGSVYRYAFGSEGRRPWFWKTHVACDEAVQIVVMEAPYYVYDGESPRVLDFEDEDFETVREIDPEVWAAVI